MTTTAMLDVKVLPWRPRARVMDPDRLRDSVDPLSIFDDGLHGIVIGLALWLAIIILAPVIVLALAAVLLSVELPVVVALALVLALIRFAGVLPWVVVIVDGATGTEGARPTATSGERSAAPRPSTADVG